jgi:hypothetical protein
MYVLQSLVKSQNLGIVGTGFERKFKVLAIDLFAKPSKVVGAGFEQKFKVLAIDLFAKPYKSCRGGF